MNRRELIEDIATQASSWRRTLHQHPQTSYEETFASEFVAEKLREWGIHHEVGFGKTGIAASIQGREESSETIGFRADMDALDIQEEGTSDWTSRYPGKMHACGHDGHTATVLALAKYLQATKNFKGTVRLIFQPAEEGGRGAERMVRDGLFERFPVQEMFGFHNWPYSPKGQFQISGGYVLAAADVFSIKLTGRGGHGAFPHKASDLVLGASQIAIAIQSIVSREIDAHKPAVISITNLNAGTGAANVLPSEAVLTGTARSFDPCVRNLIEDRLQSISHGIANTFGLTAAVEYSRITDAVFNHEKSASCARSAAGSIVSTANIVEQVPIMGGEDFGFFLERIPGVFVFVGQAGPSVDSPHSQGLHTPRYDFNDEIIPIVVEYFAELAETRLSLTDH